MSTLRALGLLLITISWAAADVAAMPSPGRYVGAAVVEHHVGGDSFIRLKSTRRVEAVVTENSATIAIDGPRVFESGNVLVGGFGLLDGTKPFGRFLNGNYGANWTRTTIQVRINAPATIISGTTASGDPVSTSHGVIADIKLRLIAKDR